MGVHEVRCDKGGTVRVGDHFFLWKKKRKPEVNSDKTKYMDMSWVQNAGRSRRINIDNSSFERVEEFKYLEKTLTNQNFIQE